MTHKEPRIVRGRYLEDILAQPAALSATVIKNNALPAELDTLRQRLASGRFKRIVLTGMGSSFHCLTPLYLALANHGYEVSQLETSELIHYVPGLLQPESLVIVVSQSGRSAEIIRLLELTRGRSTVLAITNTPQSPLALAADAVILTEAGDEFSVSSKTYVCTLAVVEMLASFFRHEDQAPVHHDLLAAADYAATYLEGWQQHVIELAPYLTGREHLFFVGRGVSVATAATGALITKESVAVHAEALSSAALRHGPMEMLHEDTLVIVLEGVPATRELNQKLLHDVSESPAKALLLGYHADLTALRIPQSPLRLLPILEILPLQMMTIALGYLAAAEAGVFQRGTKVTVTE